MNSTTVLTIYTIFIRAFIRPIRRTIPKFHEIVSGVYSFSRINEYALNNSLFPENGRDISEVINHRLVILAWSLHQGTGSESKHVYHVVPGLRIWPLYSLSVNSEAKGSWAKKIFVCHKRRVKGSKWRSHL